MSHFGFNGARRNTGRLALCLVFILTMHWPNPASQIRAAEPEPGTIPGSQKTVLRLAIGGFSNFSDAQDLQHQDLQLGDLLAAKLSQEKGFELVERPAIELVRKEMEMSLTQLSKQADTVKAGRLLRADWLVIGSISGEKGTNFLIAKIIDAKTGVVRDLTAVPLSRTNLMSAADSLTQFTINSAKRISTIDQRIFIGIGGFEDLSINNKYPDFRKSLRAALEKTYQGTRVAIVERSMVNPLLNELRMSMGGLTETVANGSIAQPAFVLVDGCYQSYQDEQAKINLVLRFQEVGGGQEIHLLKEPPGPGLEQKVTGLINDDLKGLHQREARPARKEEAQAQLERGKERSRLPQAFNSIYPLGGYPGGGDGEAKRLRNISDAIAAFESTILLDPDNAEAKLYLAVCLLAPDINKKTAGRDYLCEVIAGSPDAHLVRLAREELVKSYFKEDDRHALELMLALARDTEDPVERARIHGLLPDPVERLHRERRLSTEEGLELYSKLFLAQCESAERLAQKGQFIEIPAVAENTFVLFGRLNDGDVVTGENYLEKFLPKVSEQHPGLAPYIWICYTEWRTYGSQAVPQPVPQPVWDRLKESLVFCRDQPEKVPQMSTFKRGFLPKLLELAVMHKVYELGEIARQIRQGKAGVDDLSQTPSDILFLEAYCESEQGKWKEALGIYESLQGHVVYAEMPMEGPWGKKGTRIFTDDAVGVCRQHLGLQPGTKSFWTEKLREKPEEPPKAFNLGAPELTIGRSIVFACDGNKIWLADGVVPFVYDLGDKQLKEVNWPVSFERNISCVTVDKERVWWGTRGNGLVQVDKRTGNYKIYDEADGLPLLNITSLGSADQGGVWVGYGKDILGGMGFIDLHTGKFVGFTPELAKSTVASRYGESSAPGNEPPRKPVLGIQQTTSNDLWIAEYTGLRHFSIAEKKWSSPSNYGLQDIFCVAANTNFAVFGGRGYDGGLVIHNINANQSAHVQIHKFLAHKMGSLALPNKWVYSLAMDGDHVWVGGLGYLALVNANTKRVEKLCELDVSFPNFDSYSSHHFQCLQIVGEDLWVGLDNQLYRLPKEGP
ncbi:CsgG/HfaB family protein [Pedosphaera parvula]|uniref:Curli production assembly/transport component CsgG n=1 Tax=Pedosphaera parvula (strain Ellin514) TaxID=320771 RepID=B9XBZ8_PEDPL|nr:CsgG/HfaB family protein [Pedosphaera parvula]EEF62466.1 hypothetical protein Cflav_PD5101 [Pedosphaera parvula Ellin514]